MSVVSNGSNNQMAKSSTETDHDGQTTQVVQDSQTRDFSNFAYADSPLGIEMDIKTHNEDFIVDEVLPFELSGEGEHAWLHIRKKGCNTDWVAKQLAKLAGTRLRNVGYAGLKDRHGITSQWFSVHLPGLPDPDWSPLETNDIENIEILDCRRHSRKLRRGALKLNRFQIRLRNIANTDEGLDRSVEEIRGLLIARCKTIAELGVPNYFGPQRFGHNMANLAASARMFTQPQSRIPRHLKSLYLSSARSWIFNQLLSQRVKQANWNQRVAGDVFMLEGKTACFWDDATEDLDQRIAQGEIHPTAILWGEGELTTTGDVRDEEMRVVNENPVFRDGLCDFAVRQMRRALRVIPRDLSWQVHDEAGSSMGLIFTLPAGSYATMVLRELGNVRDAHTVAEND